MCVCGGKDFLELTKCGIIPVFHVGAGIQFSCCLPPMLPAPCPGTGSSPGHLVPGSGRFCGSCHAARGDAALFKPRINLFYCRVKKKQKFGAIMPMGPPPIEHSPPSLRQDDSAQIIPLIVSTCADSQLGPSFPRNLHKLDP